MFLRSVTHLTLPTMGLGATVALLVLLFSDLTGQADAVSATLEPAVELNAPASATAESAESAHIDVPTTCEQTSEVAAPSVMGCVAPLAPSPTPNPKGDDP